MTERNVLGGDLEPRRGPRDGVLRSGSCSTGPEDSGVTPSARSSRPSSAHQSSIGNDLSTPMPQYAFPDSCRGTAGA